jgi:hypothetical protein
VECGEEMGARKGSTHTMKNHIRVRDRNVLNVKFSFCENPLQHLRNRKIFGNTRIRRIIFTLECFEHPFSSNPFLRGHVSEYNSEQH